MVHVVADAAYHSPALRVLPAGMAWTFQLMSNAALYQVPPPPPSGTPTRPGRTRISGDRLGTVREIIRHVESVPTSVAGRSIAVFQCRWARSSGRLPLRLILVRDPRRQLLIDPICPTCDHPSCRRRRAERLPRLGGHRAEYAFEHAQAAQIQARYGHLLIWWGEATQSFWVTGPVGLEEAHDLETLLRSFPSAVSASPSSRRICRRREDPDTVVCKDPVEIPWWERPSRAPIRSRENECTRSGNRKRWMCLPGDFRVVSAGMGRPDKRP